jgi:S-adenosylmethionine decarboxylase
MRPPISLIAAGTEWVVDAIGCEPDLLRSEEVLRHLFDELVRDLLLTPAAAALWKVFPGEAGVTGLWMLQESHLTVHTFPEHATAAINLYCCAERPEWDWARGLAHRLGATAVSVRVLKRGNGAIAESRSPWPRNRPPSNSRVG